MPRVIATTQFVFLALGMMALNVLERTITATDHSTAGIARSYLVAKGLWLFLVPFGWLIFARIALNANSGAGMTRLVQVSGVAIAAIIFLVYGWLILSAGV